MLRKTVRKKLSQLWDTPGPIGPVPMGTVQPVLGVLLLGAYSYAAVAALHYGTRAGARRCCRVSLSFPFWPLALTTAGVWAVTATSLLSPGIFFASGIGLVLLQFGSALALGVTYVAADGVYTACQVRRAPLPTCASPTDRGCAIRAEAHARMAKR